MSKRLGVLDLAHEAGCDSKEHRIVGRGGVRLLVAGILGAVGALPAGMAMTYQLGPRPRSAADAWLPAIFASGALLGILFVVSIVLARRRGNARKTAIRALAGVGVDAVELGAVAAFYLVGDRIAALGGTVPTPAVIILVLGYKLSFAVAACAIATAVVFALTPGVSEVPIRSLRPRWLLLGLIAGVGAALGAWLYVVLFLFIDALRTPGMLVSDAIAVTDYIHQRDRTLLCR